MNCNGCPVMQGHAVKTQVELHQPPLVLGLPASARIDSVPGLLVKPVGHPLPNFARDASASPTPWPTT